MPFRMEEVRLFKDAIALPVLLVRGMDLAHWTLRESIRCIAARKEGLVAWINMSGVIIMLREDIVIIIMLYG